MVSCGGEEPTIASFVAAESSVAPNSSTTLTPVFSGGTGRIDHGIGTVTSGTAVATGSLAADAEFTLTVTNANGKSASKTIVIAVHGATEEPTIASFVAAASSVDLDSGTTLTAVFSGGTGRIDPGIGTVTSGTAVATGNLTADTEFTLTVTNANGKSASQTIVIAVHGATEEPTIASFVAAESSVAPNSSTMLTAVFSGGTGRIDPGVGTVTSGTAVATGSLTANTVFALTVTNANGKRAIGAIVVRVQPAHVVDPILAQLGTTENALNRYALNFQIFHLLDGINDGRKQCADGRATMAELPDVTAPKARLEQLCAAMEGHYESLTTLGVGNAALVAEYIEIDKPAFSAVCEAIPNPAPVCEQLATLAALKTPDYEAMDDAQLKAVEYAWSDGLEAAQQ